MNYKKLLSGLVVMAALALALLVIVGCNGEDCGYNCDGGPACGLACNGYGGCVGSALMDGCTVVGCSICDACGSCIGCGMEYGDLNLLSEKSAYMVGDVAYIYAEVDGYDYSEAVFISILSDTSGSAKIKRTGGHLELTSSKPTSVTVEAKLGEYMDTITIEFVDAEEILRNYSVHMENIPTEMYMGQYYELYLAGSSSVISVDQSKVRYTLTDNTAEATLNSDYDYQRIRAAKDGSVTVKAEYTVGGKTFSCTETLEFRPTTVRLTIASEQRIGDRVSLYYELLPYNYSNLPENITFEVISGKATVEMYNGVHTIIATEEGEVTLQMNYNDGNLKVSNTATLTFTKRGFTISANTTDLYVGDTIQLSATSDAPNFIPAGVSYVVLDGDAHVEGPSLTVVTPGTIHIKGYYNHNGASLESNVLELTFTKRSITIGTDAADLYVGYDIPLNATSDAPGFDAGAVVYRVVSGNATVNGSILKADAPGTVVVEATYDHNGSTLESNRLELTFGYDANTIRTAEDLRRLEGSNATFNVIQDIDLSSIADWEPINNFTGTLRGNGFTISGLQITVSHLDSYQGLFGTLGGTVDNLTLEGTMICRGEANHMGLLCGQNNGTISNVTVSGSIDAEYCNYVGGVAGVSSNSHVTNVEASVKVTANDYVGGVMGAMTANRNASVMVKGIINQGTVIGHAYVGGIAGHMAVASAQNNDQIIATDLVNNGDIMGTDNCVGGIFGYAAGNFYDAYYASDDRWSNLEITACTNTGAVSGVNYIGGLVGHAATLVNKIALSDNSGDVTGNMYVGGFAGYATGTTMWNLRNNIIVTGKVYVGGIAGVCGKLDSCENSGTLVAIGYHLDSNNNPMSYVGGLAGYATGAVNCTNNSEITVPDGGYYVGGIMGYLEATRSSAAEIRGNSNHGSVVGTSYVGGIAGAMQVQSAQNNDTITVADNANDGVITASGNCAGGIFGQAAGHFYDAYYNSDDRWSNVKITGCSNEASVSGVDYVGGIVGRAPTLVAEVSLCTSTGDVTGNTYVGGFAGRADGTTMRNLKNSNSVIAKAYVGGIAGHCGKLENCENNGVITCTGYHLADNNDPLSYAGGLAGYATGALNCVNNADVIVETGGYYVGGIVGYLHASRSAAQEIRNNKNHGAVTGTCYVGGIAGVMQVQSAQNSDTILVTDNKNDGAITASQHSVGGIFGYAAGHFYDSYYSSDDRWSNVRIVNCSNEADVTGADYIGGIVGNCATLVVPDDVVWGTNTFIGTLYGEGEHKGDKYGHMG